MSTPCPRPPATPVTPSAVPAPEPMASADLGAVTGTGHKHGTPSQGGEPSEVPGTQGDPLCESPWVPFPPRRG